MLMSTPKVAKIKIANLPNKLKSVTLFPAKINVYRVTHSGYNTSPVLR